MELPEVQVPFDRGDRYVLCPNCGTTEHQVDHLKVGFDTEWYCKGCERSFRLVVLDDGRIRVTPGTRVGNRRLVALRSRKPVTLIVEDRDYGYGSIGEERAFHYDEHTCPTNYMPNVVVIIDDSGDQKLNLRIG